MSNDCKNLPPAGLNEDELAVWHEIVTAETPELTALDKYQIHAACTVIARHRADPDAFRSTDFSQLDKLIEHSRRVIYAAENRELYSK